MGGRGKDYIAHLIPYQRKEEIVTAQAVRIDDKQQSDLISENFVNPIRREKTELFEIFEKYLDLRNYGSDKLE